MFPAVPSFAINSTTILEDYAGTHKSLTEIEERISNKNINENNFGITRDEIENIIGVYNENASYIIDSVTKDIERTKPYEFLKASNSLTEKQDLEYNNSREEISKLRKAGYYLSQDLSKKILSVIEKFNKLTNEPTSYKSLIEIPTTVQPQHFIPTLRLSEDRYQALLDRVNHQRRAERQLEQSTKLTALSIEASPTASQHTSKPIFVSRECSTSFSARHDLNLPEIVLPGQDPQLMFTGLYAPTLGTTTHCKAAVLCRPELDSASTLGICCHPNWASEPIPFIKDRMGGWDGKVPTDTEWKCVVIKNGQVEQWEKLEGNRRCGAEKHLLMLHVEF